MADLFKKIKTGMNGRSIDQKKDQPVVFEGEVYSSHTEEPIDGKMLYKETIDVEEVEIVRDKRGKSAMIPTGGTLEVDPQKMPDVQIEETPEYVQDPDGLIYTAPDPAPARQEETQAPDPLQSEPFVSAHNGAAATSLETEPLLPQDAYYPPQEEFLGEAYPADGPAPRRKRRGAHKATFLRMSPRRRALRVLSYTLLLLAVACVVLYGIVFAGYSGYVKGVRAQVSEISLHLQYGSGNDSYDAAQEVQSYLDIEQRLHQLESDLENKNREFFGMTAFFSTEDVGIADARARFMQVKPKLTTLVAGISNATDLKREVDAYLAEIHEPDSVEGATEGFRERGAKCQADIAPSKDLPESIDKGLADIRAGLADMDKLLVQTQQYAQRVVGMLPSFEEFNRYVQEHGEPSGYLSEDITGIKTLLEKMDRQQKSLDEINDNPFYADVATKYTLTDLGFGEKAAQLKGEERALDHVIESLEPLLREITQQETALSNAVGSGDAPADKKKAILQVRQVNQQQLKQLEELAVPDYFAAGKAQLKQALEGRQDYIDHYVDYLDFTIAAQNHAEKANEYNAEATSLYNDAVAASRRGRFAQGHRLMEQANEKNTEAANETTLKNNANASAGQAYTHAQEAYAAYRSLLVKPQ